KAHPNAPHNKPIQRNETLKINGPTFTCMGADTSRDRKFRVEGVSYWRQEHIGEEDMENGWRNLREYENKVDFVLTHCINATTTWFAFHMDIDEDCAKLEQIEAKVQYKMWLFGHYHKDMFVADNKACLYNEIGYLDESSDILFSLLPND
ncbi:MAG: hypothetical protein K6B65_02475, partial [Bacilli bacterium]|nr:hypothetical protein [Bacilli bacterium]